jgi:hypothetical protein
MNQLDWLPELDMLGLLRVHALYVDAEEMVNILEFNTIDRKLQTKLFELRLEEDVNQPTRREKIPRRTINMDEVSSPTHHLRDSHALFRASTCRLPS